MYQKLEADLHAAQKAKDAFAVKVLRFLKSHLDAEAKTKLKPLTAEEEIRVIQRRIKQSEEAKDKYRQGGRAELVAAEQQEMDLLTTYLPAQLSDEEIVALVTAAVERLGAAGSKDFGRVMGAVVKEVAGRAGGARIKAAVERALNQ